MITARFLSLPAPAVIIGAVILTAALSARAFATEISVSNAMSYHGICEASAAVSLDDTHFAVASDETNDIHVYERGKPEPIATVNVTGLDKSDIEGAARVGDRIYWISSHSFNRDGEDKPKRKIFFATALSGTGGGISLAATGTAERELRDGFPSALAGEEEDQALINIEGLAASADGSMLLLGFRSPVHSKDKPLVDAADPADIIDKAALVLSIRNPAAILDDGAQPEVGELLALDLGGRGIRSLEWVGRDGVDYIIAAGTVSDGDDFALYSWAGPGDREPKELKATLPLKFRPEAMLAIPGSSAVQLLSDDGDGIDGDGPECRDDKTPVEERRFRSIDLVLTP